MKDREATTNFAPGRDRQRGLSQKFSHSFLAFFRKHGAKRSVCLAEPSMPTAPLGGRLREADTRPCLVVSSVFVACTA